MRPSADRAIALPERLILATLLALFAWWLHSDDALWRWDRLLYDTQIDSWSRTSHEDIIIVAIDDASLSELGQWPWPRSNHARLIDILNADGAHVISLDIIFAEHDRRDRQGDLALARSMMEHGNVVLPVLMTQSSKGGLPREVLPIPDLAEHAAAMGHVHIELDTDGIAREVFLFEGLGTPYWPHLSLVMIDASITGDPNIPDASMMSWHRADKQLIPFAGPPGHFPRVSYANVLSGDFPTGTFEGKYVLVGTTATGLGDALPSPVSGHSHAMPGVELNANILDARLNSIEITPAHSSLKIAFDLFFAILPFLLYPYLHPRTNLIASILMISSAIITSGGLLWIAGLWVSPVTACLLVALSYPLWSWRRLEHAMRFMDEELSRLDDQRRQVELVQTRSTEKQMRFLKQLLNLDGWQINQGNRCLYHDERRLELPPDVLESLDWITVDSSSWRRLQGEDHSIIVGLHRPEDQMLSSEELALIDTVITKQASAIRPTHSTSSDIVQSRIQQIRLASERLNELRRFVDKSMSNMSDGVIVCDTSGQVILSNARASWYMRADDDAELESCDILELLSDVIMQGGGQWSQGIRKTLIDHQHFSTQARHRDGRDLLIQIAPLNLDGENVSGMIINLSDLRLLKASERKRDEMLNFLSHDIRSPLASILALIELANSRPTEAMELIGRMQTYTEKTLHMAEQFLQLSRVKSSEELPFYDMDLVSITLNAYDQMWLQAQQRDIRLTRSISMTDLWIKGDPDLMERCIINLLSNAIKYSDEGTEVLLELEQDGEGIHCRVTDQGPGIAEQDLPHLFELFKRVNKEQGERKQGIGLGLAFVDAVCQRHGGHIEVQSSQGEGSIFTIQLPG